MGLEFNDGKITGSSWVAKAGLTLGIICTGLAVLQNGGFGLFGNGATSEVASLDAQIAELKSMRYTDAASMDAFERSIAQSNAEDAKINALQTQLYNAFIDLDKRSALNEQAAKLNREFDTASRDYLFTIVNNKIDCCCNKVATQIEYNKQLNELADASIIFTNINIYFIRIY